MVGGRERRGEKGGRGGKREEGKKNRKREGKREEESRAEQRKAERGEKTLNRVYLDNTSTQLGRTYHPLQLHTTAFNCIHLKVRTGIWTFREF